MKNDLIKKLQTIKEGGYEPLTEEEREILDKKGIDLEKLNINGVVDSPEELKKVITQTNSRGFTNEEYVYNYNLPHEYFSEEDEDIIFREDITGEYIILLDEPEIRKLGLSEKATKQILFDKEIRDEIYNEAVAAIETHELIDDLIRELEKGNG